MHESSLVQALLRQIESIMRDNQATRVISLRVNVGAFSGVEPELFRYAYDALSEDSPVRGARLEMEVVPLECHCRECDDEFAVQDFRFECPSCESSSVSVIRGEGIVLENVTLERD
jgi:hydrogenase nickel incorporation protein HypA/HybF